MWETLQERVEGLGTPVHLNRRCAALHHADGHVERLVMRWNGSEQEVDVDAVLSSIPLGELVLSLEPHAPPEVRAAARRLRYRDMCLVALMTNEPEPFPDNWIYLHDPGIRAGRVQNFGAWSRDMVPAGSTCLGVEYFCFEGDDVWESSDEQAVRLATAELASIGLVDPARVVDGVKVRVPRAYPMYDSTYADSVAVLREYLAGFDNLQTCGRNGLHRYNNQDHSMWTGILAALNLVDGARHDVWSVNTDAIYHEQGAVIDDALDLQLAAFRQAP
jgi:protoporphyrinogen oxidase